MQADEGAPIAAIKRTRQQHFILFFADFSFIIFPTFFPHFIIYNAVVGYRCVSLCRVFPSLFMYDVMKGAYLRYVCKLYSLYTVDNFLFILLTIKYSVYGVYHRLCILLLVRVYLNRFNPT